MSQERKQDENSEEFTYPKLYEKYRLGMSGKIPGGTLKDSSPIKISGDLHTDFRSWLAHHSFEYAKSPMNHVIIRNFDYSTRDHRVLADFLLRSFLEMHPLYDHSYVHEIAKAHTGEVLVKFKKIK